MRAAWRQAAAVIVMIATVAGSVWALSRSPLAAFHPASFEAFGCLWRRAVRRGGNRRQSYLGRYDDKGDIAADFDRLGWPASVIATRYTLVLGDHPVATFTVAPGGGMSLPAPAGGAFGSGSVEFSPMRNGGRALFLDVHINGLVLSLGTVVLERSVVIG